MPMDRNKNNNESETACQNPWEGLVLQATKGIEDVFFVQKNVRCEYENNRTDVSVSGGIFSNLILCFSFFYSNNDSKISEFPITKFLA